MSYSAKAADELDIAMGTTREDHLDLAHFVCFTAGWSFAVTAVYARMVKRMPRIFARNGEPSTRSRFAYFMRLTRVVPIVGAFVDSLATASLSEDVRAVANLEDSIRRTKVDPIIKTARGLN